MTNKDLPAEEAHWLLKEIAEQKAEIDHLRVALGVLWSGESPFKWKADFVAEVNSLLGSKPTASEPSAVPDCPRCGVAHYPPCPERPLGHTGGSDCPCSECVAWRTSKSGEHLYLPVSSGNDTCQICRLPKLQCVAVNGVTSSEGPK